jgi:hypothetical protein
MKREKNQDEPVGFIEWPISIGIIVYISQSFSVFMQKVHRMISFLLKERAVRKR